MGEDCLNGLDADGLFNVAERVEAELVYCIEGGGVLHVVLDDVDIVGDGEETGKCRRLAVP